MKKNLSLILLISVFLVGLSLVLYPTIANYWNQRTQSKAVRYYDQAVLEIDDSDCEELFAQADEYNRKLRSLASPLIMCDKIGGYEDILSIAGTGVMGYITIEKINVELPVYHGTSDDVLSSAVGHLKGSSLPVGGEGTHCILSAHRGLPSAKLFTNLGKMQVGDTFTLTVLNRVLTYEVDQIVIVKPNEIDELSIVDGEDYCTLLTCTPYGINSHRLLVRGVRIEGAAQKPRIYISNEAYRIDPLIVTPVVAAPMLLVLLIVLLVKYKPKNKRK